MLTLSGSTGGHSGDAITIISPHTSLGDIIIISGAFCIHILLVYKRTTEQIYC